MERKRRWGRHFLAVLWILLSAVRLLVFLYTIVTYTAKLHANQQGAIPVCRFLFQVFYLIAARFVSITHQRRQQKQLWE